MMDGRAGHGQGLARGGVFGEFLDGDHLLTAGAGTSSAESWASATGASPAGVARRRRSSR